MSSETTYSPGTLFRIFADNGSKHFTAVLLKDGQVLEVKNPDTKTRVKFPSVTMWRASHGASEDELKVDRTKSSGIITGSDTHGFDYPNKWQPSYSWVSWLYMMIGEAAPQLFKSEELKTLYNEMVALCKKHEQELRHWDFAFKGSRRYEAANLKSRSSVHSADKWCGFPGYFYCENYSYSPYSGPGHKRYKKEDYDAARAEIVAVYNKIYDIVETHVGQYMAKKQKVISTQRNLSQSKSAIKRFEKKLAAAQSSIDWYKKNIITETAKLAKYEEELLASKMADV